MVSNSGISSTNSSRRRAPLGEPSGPNLKKPHPHQPRGRRSTPQGEHRPVLLNEVLAALDPKPGQVVVDCTVGWAGHAAELLNRVGPTGRLVGFDLDPDNLPRARARLEALGHPFTLHQGNFAEIGRAHV